jgi:ABC-2 type transport system ATP-binding protein
MIEILVDSVQKSYSTVQAVRGLSFTVSPGKVFALLGPNGAGKSSLIRMLVGLTKPDQGAITVRIQGEIVDALPETSFAYLPEDRGLYPDKTVVENLTYIGKLRGLSRQQINDELAHWLPRFDLQDKAKDNLSKLSKGNQQKVQLISCLIHHPKLLVLDEPFSGLDPVNQEHVLTILNELRESGTTILLSAHQMALIERLADEMLLLNKGQKVAHGNLSEVIEQLSPRKLYAVSFAQLPELEQIESCDAVLNAQIVDQQVVLELRETSTVNQLLTQMMALGELIDFGRQRPSLHDLYLAAVQTHNASQETQMAPSQVKE